MNNRDWGRDVPQLHMSRLVIKPRALCESSRKIGQRRLSLAALRPRIHRGSVPLRTPQASSPLASAPHCVHHTVAAVPCCNLPLTSWTP